MRKVVLFLVTIISIFLPAAVSAADFVWTAGAGTSDWDNPNNWDLMASYPGELVTTDTATISGLTATQPDLNTTVEIATLTMTNGATLTSSLNSNLTVNTTATLNTTINFSGASSLTVQNVSLTANSSITTVTGDITVSPAGTVDGNFNLTMDAGTGDFVLEDAVFGPTLNNLSFDTDSGAGQQLPDIDIDGSLTFLGSAPGVYNDVDDNVTIDVGGNLNITTAAGGLISFGDSFAGTIIVGGDFVFNGGTVEIITSGNVDLGPGTATNTLSVESSAGITNNGGDLNVTGTSDFTAGNGQDIVLRSGGNQFGGNVTFGSGGTLDDVRLVDTSGGFNVQNGLTVGDDFYLEIAGNIDFLGPFTSNGTPVELVSGGNITATAGALDVSSGALNLDTGGTGSVTLSHAGNDFNTVSIDISTTATTGSVGDTYIVDSNGIVFGNFDAGADDLRVEASGDITQTGLTAITTNGLAVVTTGNVNLMEANEFDTLAMNVTGQADVSDNDGDGFDINTVLTVAQASAGTIVLESNGAVSQTNSISATNLAFTGSGNFTLNNISNAVATIASDTSGAISYIDTDALIVGSVTKLDTTTVTGITNSTGVTLESDTSSLTVNQGITVSADVTLTSTTTTTVNAAIDCDTTGDIMITADGNVTQTAQVICDGLEFYGAGEVTFTHPLNNAVELAGNTTNDISYYDFNGFAIFNLEAVPAGLWSTGNITLDSDGAVTQNGDYIVAAGLELLGNGSYSLGTVANDVDSLAANIDSFLDFLDSDDVTIATVGTAGITTTSDAVSITTTAGPITVSQQVSTGSGTVGDVTLTAGGGTGTIDLNAAVITGTGDLTLNAGGAVNQTVVFNDVTGLELLGAGPFNLNIAGGNEVTTLAANVTGNITYVDSDALSLGTVNTTVGATLAANILDIETINGGLTVDSAVDSNGGNIILDVGTTAGGTLMFNAATAADAGDITATTTGAIGQAAGGTVTSTGTTTLTANGGASDILLNSAAANDFGILEATGLTVRILDATGLTLNDISATNFDLDAGGAVIQTVGDSIQTTGLLLQGAGPFTLTENNNAVTIAADTTGAISYTDTTADLDVGTVLGTNGITTTDDTVILNVQGAATGALTVSQAINTIDVAVGANIELTANDTIDLNAALTAGTGDIILNAGGAVNQTAAFSGAGLLLEGAGPFDLAVAGGNNITTLAADSVSGYIDYLDADAFAIGTVQGVLGVITTTAGDTVNLANALGNITVDQVITTAGEAIAVTAAGSVDINAAVSTGGPTPGNITIGAGTGVTVDAAVSSGLGNVIIDSDGAVSQTAVLSGTGIRLIGDGPIDLSTQNNQFTDLAANVTNGGSVAYNDANDITITTVGATTGITTANANIDVTSSGGGITVSQAVASTGGIITLTANTSVDVDAAVTSGSGTINITATTTYVDINAPVSTGSGVAGDLVVTSGTTIDLDAAVITGAGDLTLNAGGAVNQTAAFNDVTGLELLGAGPFNLNIAGGNEVTTLAANVTGDITYVDSDALSLGTVNTVGATLAANILDIETINGSLTVDSAVDSNGGNIVLDVGTTANGILTFNAATAADAGDITVTTTPASAAAAINQAVAGAITSTGTTTLTAGSGSADIDLTLANNQFGTLVLTADQAEVHQYDEDLILGNIDATIFSLDAELNANSSEVTQVGAIDDGTGTSSLLLLGDGPFRLLSATNDIGTLAADITGAMTYQDADSYAVGSVLGYNGIDGNAVGGLVVCLMTNFGGTLSQTQPVIVPRLQLIGAGDFDLDGVGTNNVNYIAADVSGQLDYEDVNWIGIDSVTNTEGTTDNGIDTNGGQLDFVAGGNIQINQPVTTDAGLLLVFDSGGTIFFNETDAADTIFTSNAAGLDNVNVLNDPIVLNQNSSIVSTSAAGDIRIRNTINDDTNGWNLSIDSGADITLDGDVGNTDPIDNLILTTPGAGTVNLAADLDVTLNTDLTINDGTYAMNNANQSVAAGGDITGTGTCILYMTAAATITAQQDITVPTLQIGSINGAPYATINVGQDFAPTAFTHDDVAPNADDSEVIFFDDTGDLASQAGTYTFQNLTLNDPDELLGADVQSTGNWTILGVLDLSDGNWDLDDGGGRTHYVHHNWDSSGGFTYDPANSTIVFDGADNATLLTDGIAGSESFNNLTFDKTSGSSVTMTDVGTNRLDVTGILTISDGEFIARATTTADFDIRVAGDWIDTTNTPGDGFDPRNEEVLFTGGASNIDPEQGDYPAAYFWQLTIEDSDATLINNPMLVGNNLSIEAPLAAASFTTNADLEITGNVVVDAAAAAALLTCNGVFTANSDVTLQGANSPVIDFTDQDFHFDGGLDSLDNSLGDADPDNDTSGEIRLTGEQAVQDFPTVTGGDEYLYGLVTYYAGAADGEVVESTHLAGSGAHFWNLTINASLRAIVMGCDITVWGFSDPNGDGTLSNNPGPVNPAILNGLRILNGSLVAENGAVQYDIILHGMFLTTNVNTAPVAGGLSYLWGTVPIADPNGASVIFQDTLANGHANPVYIEGDNTFFRFIVNTGADALSADGVDANVAGKRFYFEALSTTTIADFADARFTVVGTDNVAADTPFLNDPDWIRLLSGTDDPGTGVSRWGLSKLANAIAVMRYVYVEDSNASADPIVIQPFVITENCIGWVDYVYVTLSETRDQLNAFTGAADAANELPGINNTVYEPDGRIDRLLINVQAAVVKDFSGFAVEVDGYDVLGYDPGDDAGDWETLGPTQFWVILEEGDYLDTGATPAWRILENTTLIDSSTGAPVSIYSSKSEEIPYDGAPPIIGYTLAVADSTRNELFVHFSEPVVDDAAGAVITASNFDLSSIGINVTSISRVSPYPAPSDNGMQEVILNLDNTISVPNITGNALSLSLDPLDTGGFGVEDIQSPNSAYADDAADPADTTDALLVTTHRVSDIALGITGNGIVEPVVATGETRPSGGTGVGVVSTFDGTDFLQDEDITLQAHRYAAEVFIPDLYWEDSNLVPGSYKNGILWLPAFDEVANSGGTPFSGLVPRPWSIGPDSDTMNAVASELFDYDWLSTEAKITDGANLDFFFEVAADLYAGRCDDETASDWYRRVEPWSVLIREVVTQAGGISILNNIINPNRNELTSLHYELSRGGIVTIQVFDLAGGLVEILQRGYQDAGEYSVSWDGRNRAGNVVARGIYFVRYVGPGGIDQIRKVLVVK